MRVQHWLPEALEADFEGAECDACGMVHFVNRKGEVFGAKDRDKRPVTWELSGDLSLVLPQKKNA
jgi:hypothetical protein